jgi:hypothetical protein
MYEVKAPRHVDMKPVNAKFEIDSCRSQLRPIKYDPELCPIAAEEYYRRGLPQDVVSYPDLVPHIAMMAERVEFFLSHYAQEQFDGKLLVYRSIALGPSFTNTYSKWWKDSRFAWCDTIRNVPVDIKDIGITFNDYNSTFPPFFFIFWKEDTDDYKWMMEEAPPTDPEIIAELEGIVSSYSEKYLPDADFSAPDSFVWAPTSSNAFTGVDNKPEWEIEYDDPFTDDIDNALVFSRGVAMKRPSEVRDIGLMTPQSMRLHRTMMYPMQRVARLIPDCVYGRDQEFIRRECTRIGDSGHYFFMRDYVKSGMTIHHDVVCAVIRGFYARDPKKAEYYSKVVKRSRVHVKKEDGEWFSFFPSTGFPLGMFVEGYTLLQYAVNQMVSSRVGRRPQRFNGNNDDMIASFLTLEHATEYFNTDVSIQSDLGLSVKGTKTGISIDKFIYAEEYWDGSKLLFKDMLFCMSLIGARFAINVVHAKELVNSILMSCQPFVPKIRLAVKYVQEAYKCEFSEQEVNWPYLFGGWWPCFEDGLDTSIKWRDGDAIADCAYWASRTRIRMNKELKTKATLAYGRKRHMTLTEIPTDPEDLRALKPLFGSKKCLKEYYNLISRAPREIKRKYAQLFLRRRERFNSYMTGKQDCPSVVHGWLRRHPNSVILKTMYGVKYSKVGFLVKQPLLGITIHSTESRLGAMMARGLLTTDKPFPLSKSEKSLHALGITKELAVPFVPVSEGGLPMSHLQFGLRGLVPFYNETGMFIKTIDDDDEQFNYTAHWEYCPLPLVWLLRCESMVRQRPQFPHISPDNASWWFKMVTKVELSVLEDIINWDNVPSTIELIQEDPTDPFAEYVRTLLDAVKIPEFKARIVNLESSFNRESKDDNVQNTTVIDGVLYKETLPGNWIKVQSDANLDYESEESDFGLEDGDLLFG